MECVGRAVHEGGGLTIGVIPTLVEKGGRQSQYVDVEIPCDNLDDRKHLMQVQCDVAVALPGGIGTLDEVFTLAASHTIGYHQKMVILYNIDGFWDSLVAPRRLAGQGDDPWQLYAVYPSRQQFRRATAVARAGQADGRIGNG